MAIKPIVTKETGSRQRTSSTIDLVGDLDITKDALRKIQDDVGDFLVGKVLESVAQQKSPVSGESFRKLSTDYAEKKKALGGDPVPNMELTGDMLDSLDYKRTPEGIEIGFFNSEAWKADGHLKFSGEDGTAPKRRFLPAEGQSFKADITNEIKAIVSEHVIDSADLSQEDFADVDSKAGLYRVLEDAAPNLSRSQIRDAVLANRKIINWLDDLGILDLL